MVIPRQRDQPLREETLGLPPNTPYVVAVYEEPGDYPQAVNEAVEAAQTDLVLLGAPDMGLDRDCLEFLSDLSWDCDVTYGNLGWSDRLDIPEGTTVEGKAAAGFCPNRLSRENYLPEIALVRKEKFLEVGGLRSGYWDLWVRLEEAGARFKPVPEAYTLRTLRYEDPSPAPVARDVLASFYHQATPGTTHWRCQLPARHLPGQLLFNVPTIKQEGENVLLTNHVGAAVFQFAGDAAHFFLAQLLQADGFQTFIEVDDNYTKFHEHLKKAGWGKSIKGQDPYSAEGHIKIVEEVDGVICASDQLAHVYGKINDNVHVCPNQIDPVDWPALEKPDDGVFRIGWFASQSHLPDIPLIKKALRWASDQKDVEVVMIGLGGPRRLWKFPYKWVPWSNDFGVYRKMLQQLDVGLAPVKPTPWAACRSDLKILEYAMAGAMTVCSDAPPYANWENDQYVLKAKTDRDFLTVIKHLVQNKDEARQKAIDVREYVLAERTMAKNIHLWRTAIGSKG